MSDNPQQQVQARKGLRLLLASTATSVTGDGMLVSAAPLMAATLTNDPVQIGLVAAAGMAAWLLVGIPAGALVDRWDRRRVMIVADVARASVLAIFVALVAAGLATVPLLAATVFAVGVGTCFFAPASVALLPDVVGKDRQVLTAANGRIWSIDTFGRSLAGPPLGAVAFTAGRLLPFAADALSFALSALFVGLLPASQRTVSDSRPVALRTQIRTGARFLFGDRELRDLAIGAGVYNFAFNIVTSTLVLFALRELGIGTVGFGLLLSSAAVGGIAAGWFAPKIIRGSSALTVYAAAFGIQAVCWLAIVLTHNLVVAAIALAVLGGTSNIITVAGASARQVRTPAEMIGRVASMSRLLGSGGAAIGAAVGGAVAGSFGLKATFWLAAVLLVAAIGAALIEIRTAKSQQSGI